MPFETAPWENLFLDFAIKENFTNCKSMKKLGDFFFIIIIFYEKDLNSAFHNVSETKKTIFRIIES